MRGKVTEITPRGRELTLRWSAAIVAGVRARAALEARTVPGLVAALTELRERPAAGARAAAMGAAALGKAPAEAVLHRERAAPEARVSATGPEALHKAPEAAVVHRERLSTAGAARVVRRPAPAGARPRLRRIGTEVEIRSGSIRPAEARSSTIRRQPDRTRPTARRRAAGPTGTATPWPVDSSGQPVGPDGSRLSQGQYGWGDGNGGASNGQAPPAASQTSTQPSGSNDAGSDQASPPADGTTAGSADPSSVPANASGDPNAGGSDGDFGGDSGAVSGSGYAGGGDGGDGGGGDGGAGGAGDLKM